MRDIIKYQHTKDNLGNYQKQKNVLARAINFYGPSSVFPILQLTTNEPQT